ncbi:MAG: glycosyltransferase [Acidobacteriales bacterium]|nr:glycosyltransferase [Terriglobales bacterium]
MNLAVNLRQYFQGRIGGLENYVRNVIGGVVRSDVFETVTVFVLETEAENVRQFAPGARVVGLNPSHAAQTIETEINSGKYDLLFCPLLVLEPLRPKIASAVTIPDLQHEYYPDFFTPEILTWRRQNYGPSAKFADIVFTISEHSKKTIVDKLGVDAGKVRVVHLDVDEEFRHPPSPEAQAAFAHLKLPADYLYFPANFWPHKNHANLLRALKLLVKEGYKDLSLLLTGASHGLDKVSRQIGELGLRRNVRILGYQDREVVAEIYRHARALVFVSKFEGFGIPILEAFHTGCPVVCSASCSCPEVAGDAAVLVDEHDPAAIAAGIRKVLEDGSLARDLSARGRSRADNYSWRRAVEITVDTLRGVPESRQKAGPVRVETYPVVSITTPSYNMAHFLEETIQSVLSQDYPYIDYTVMDGGSNDGTVELLKKYEGRLRYVSRRDRGQADAINHGCAASRGQVFAFLNADDTYLPGAVGTGARYLMENPHLGMVYGNAYYVDESGQRIGPYPTHEPDIAYLNRNCYICQPATFMRREAFKNAGWMNINQHVVLDYDLWMRMVKLYPIAKVEDYLATSRMYRQNKTIGKRGLAYREILQSVRTHFGYVPFDWVFGYSCYLADRKDQFFDKTQPSRSKYLLSLALGCFYNSRQLRRYWNEWAAATGIAAHFDGRWADGWISKRYRGDHDVPPACRAVRITGKHWGRFTRPLTLAVRLDGVPIGAEKLDQQGQFSFELPCPEPARGKRAVLEITADGTFKPVENGDHRNLSCIIDNILFED